MLLHGVTNLHTYVIQRWQIKSATRLWQTLSMTIFAFPLESPLCEQQQFLLYIYIGFTTIDLWPLADLDPKITWCCRSDLSKLFPSTNPLQTLKQLTAALFDIGLYKPPEKFEAISCCTIWAIMFRWFDLWPLTDLDPKVTGGYRSILSEILPSTNPLQHLKRLAVPVFAI